MLRFEFGIQFGSSKCIKYKQIFVLLSQDKDICIGRESLAILAAEGAMRRMTIAAGNHRVTDGLLKPDSAMSTRSMLPNLAELLKVENKKLFLDVSMEDKQN